MEIIVLQFVIASIITVYNMEDHIYLGALSEAERDSWMHAFTSASIENLRRTAEELRAGLALAQEGPLTKSSSPQPSDSSHYGSEECEQAPLITFDWNYSVEVYYVIEVITHHSHWHKWKRT